MVPTGANGGVLGFEKKNDGRPRKREEAQTKDVCQSERRGIPASFVVLYSLTSAA